MERRRTTVSREVATSLPVLRALADHDCAFVVVGSTARRFCGEPVAPRDLDVVVDPAPRQRASLIAALASVDATIERRAGTRRIVDALALSWAWGWHSETSHGPVDIVTRFIDGTTIADHHAAGVDVTVEPGLTIRCHPTRHTP